MDARTISSPTRQPAAFRTWIEVAPALAVRTAWSRSSCPVTVQIEGSAHEHDPAVTRSVVPPIPLMSSPLTLSVRVMVALRVWGWPFRADLQLAVQHDPLGGQFEVLIVREAQLAVDRQTVQRRRTDIEDDVHVLADGDNGVFGGHLLVGPSGMDPTSACRWPSKTLFAEP